METELISLIVPCYNVEAYLDDCLKSIEKQTYENFEVILVNDGSMDGTLDKILKFCKRFPKARFIDQKNQGVSMSRNNAVKASKGDYVCFCDADDVLHCDYLKTLYSAIKKFDADCSVVRYKWISENKKFFETKPLKDALKDTKSFSDKDEIMTEYFCGRFGFGPCNKLYKKQIFEKINKDFELFNGAMNYGEDAEFNTRYFEKINKIVLVEERLYYYRQRKNGAIYGKFNEKKLAVFNWIDTGKSLDKTIYKNAQNYILAREAMLSLEMLYRIKHSDYKNSEKIKELYLRFKQNKKYVIRGKKMPWYLRISMPLVPLYLKISLGRRMRTPKNKKTLSV